MPKRRASQALPGPEPSKPRTETDFLTETVLDEEGDLILEVKESGSDTVVLYRVNRGSLCLASPVFRAMLGKKSRFKDGAGEGKNQITPTTDLEEDDIAVFDLFLRVVHLKANTVPQSLPRENLKAIASLCDKYDFRKIMGQLPETWYSAFPHSIDTPYSDYMTIFWGFKSTYRFKRLTRDIIRNMKVQDGNYNIVPEQILSSCLFPRFRSLR